MNKTIIILGSSRSDGDTAKVVFKIQQHLNCDIVDLNDYAISYYDYAHMNQDDDFLPLMKRIINNYQNIIVATPVYWYTMSGIMKVFFDRISDLLTIEKDLGRALRGKNFAAISCCIDSSVDEEFWHPFKRSAKYLGMNYLGNVHFDSLEDDVLFTGLADKVSIP